MTIPTVVESAAATREVLLKRLENLDQMPSIPVVVYPLLRYLERPLDQVDTQKVVDYISQDKSLAAQCLHMANSPLFGRWQVVHTVRNAVMALGLQRMRDVVMSCSVLKLMPGEQSVLDPVVFWEHSLGCALISRHFARKIGFEDREKAYLAGLLHDLGIIVNLWIMPKEFHAAADMARTRHCPLLEAEREVLGITHCESGKILGERWKLTEDVIEVIACHHDVAAARTHRSLVALVSLSDLLCRMGGVGHGHIEMRQVRLQEEAAFAVLLEECPALQEFDWERFTFELEGHVDEVHKLVTALYRS